ncbi:hypothetical protein J5N97_017450 [Dioscorea zingiberensis]|uniref:Cupin type-1 domain-containing protein n=1 Tax=Dioscorea zingiberensis TaxID=325984 RepID=A0A9D5CLQ9_9LILI|nr:hypothetical protein J5N97_017450 [Dioscorea zingiberensis]
MEVDGKQGGEEKVGGSDCETSIFILNKFKKVIKSEGGEVKVVSGYRWKGDLNPMHIGFVSMEPNTLFIPQYIDANLILFIQTGEVKVGWIHKDKLVEAKLKMGDVSVIPAGSAFYFINVGNDEKLRMICSINAAGTSGWKSYQEYEESYKAWSWRKLLNSIIGKQWRKGGRVHSPEPYNLYGNEPSFCNDYGSSISIDRRQYSPLKLTGTSIYFVNLTAGSMLAPHLNPMATEYGIILKGTGIIQVVFPNGTNAMTAKVRAGDVFWVPRYFPFCQIASMDGSLEFFGYTNIGEKE